MPGIVLWAWERPEDLRFIDTSQIGIAFLAATASISREGSVAFRPRTQRLELPARAAVLPVIRIESSLQFRNSRIGPVQAEPLIAGIREIAALPDVRGIQIDFDARKSERDFYRGLLESIRASTSKPIGITALASWCAGDQWLGREPIVEAVPMFFRMGRNESREMAVQSSVCQSSIGLSTDEPWPAKRSAAVKRIYLFNPRAWLRADYTAALARIKSWNEISKSNFR